MGCSCKNLGYSSADNSTESSGPIPEESEGSKGPISNLTRGHSFDTLGRNLATFCPRPKKLPEAKLKSNGLIPLLEETSRQHSI